MRHLTGRDRMVLACGLAVLVLFAGLLFRIQTLSGIHGRPCSDVFAAGDGGVAPGQVAGNVLVVNGTARIDGVAAGWLVVVNGDLFITGTGRVLGPVLVLGGRMVADDGGFWLRPAWAVGADSVDVFYSFLACAVMVLCFVSYFAVYALKRLVGSAAGQILLQRLGAVRGHWPKLYLALGFFISSMLLASFLELAWTAVFIQHSLMVDSVVVWLVRRLAGPGMDKVMILISTVGSVGFYGLLVPAAAAVLYRWRRRREMWTLLLCMAGTGVLNQLLKMLFERERPTLFRVVAESGYSFPSGHAMGALCFYGMVAILAARTVRSRALRFSLYLVSAVAIALIGISRIYLGVHYPTDILGGYLAGAAWLAVTVSFLYGFHTGGETEYDCHNEEK